MDALYSFSRLRQSFNGREVLHIPELVLEAGKIYALTGPNGAGKTTLMRIMAFLDTPAEGDIVFRGQKITPHQGAALRGLVVWVSQFPVLFSGTLLYNIEYPMRLKGLARATCKARARELLARVGLFHLAQAPGRKLSGGEAQRACIARALAAGAEILLFDEPTANVDYHARGDIISIIRNLRDKEGLSVFVTTHDQELAALLCEERIALLDGELVHSRPLPVPQNVPAEFARPLPATLRRREGALLLVSENGDTGAISPASVTALAMDTDGVILRVRLHNGETMNRIIADDEGRAEAGKLALGSHIEVRR